MRYQEQAVKLTQRALDDICRAAMAIPEDRLTWAPMGEARSTLDQMQEIAITAAYVKPILQGEPPQPFGETERQHAKAMRARFDTIGKCVQEARRTVADLCQAISAVSDSQLETEVHIPFTGSGTMTMADVMLMSYWNIVYHFGQINQIQLMLGDKVMH